MSNHKNLVFFNNSGDYLNFNYKSDVDRFEGDILFDENSTDTFKTYGLYMFEDIPSFEYELPGVLTLDKFQLFNEFGIDIYAARYENEIIERIEPINNDSSFYSKWIYGINFETKFPIGSIIAFDSTLMEFSNLDQTFVVVSSKKNAIMILSNLDNATFESTYYSIYIDPTTYIGKTISGKNILGIYNYVDSMLINNLSNWSEPNFYDKLYNGKKLNIVNSTSNDGTITIDNCNLQDTIYYEYDASTIPTGSKLIIEVILKTDLPKIYDGPINITNDGKINFTGLSPVILKPGSEFKIVGSTLNTNFMDVSYVPTFLGNTQLTFYATQSQVMWNNKTYQCQQSYTQSATSSITPDNTSYWTQTTFTQVDQSTTVESLLNCQVYLTTNKFYYEYGWTSSIATTLASAAEKYTSDLSIFNIDLYYKYNKIKADLIYPSNYANINFYHTAVGSTYSVGSTIQAYEKTIGIKEDLVKELNYDYSSNFLYNIVFTDLDEFGLRITINKMVYQEEIAWVYSGISPDMERTIDRTLRNWLTRHYVSLYTLGIPVELSYIGNVPSIFYNTIILRTEYPNVPFVVNSIEVGTTADFYVEHSKVLFTDLGGYLSFNINDKSYDQATIYLTGTYSQYPDIPSTLDAWTTEHIEILTDLGIYVTNINNMITFDIKDLSRRLDYTITIGKSTPPGQSSYTITNKIKGNHGMLVSSNEVLMPGLTESFETEGFATGMVFSINNTMYPFDNQEYNIQFLDPDRLGLSYQGPFWGLTDSICNSSAFVTIAFNLGFGQTGCSGSVVGGPFSTTEFNLFEFTTYANTYSVSSYDLSSYTSNLVDLIYVQLSNSIYTFGDNLVAFDSYLGQYLTNINLPGNTQSIDIEFNPVNNYLYCLSKNMMFVVDPLINTIITSMTFSYDAQDVSINTTNGDIYVSFGNTQSVNIWDSSNALTSTLQCYSNTYNMTFNSFEGDMYIVTNDASDVVLRVDGSTRTIQASYSIPGISSATQSEIYYEPVNESVYVYGSASLYKIDNGSTYSISSISTQAFGDMIFNNLTGEMNISDTSTNFTRLDLNTDVASPNSTTYYGYLALNQFDGDVYLSALNSNAILAINTSDGSVRQTEIMSATTSRIIYNPERKSVWAIQPSTTSLVEVGVTLNGVLTINPDNSETVGEGLYGTLDPDYVPKDNIWLKTREYIRKPRENFEGETPVKYYWRWFSDNIPQFFLYDFSGNQLSSTGSYAYTGVTPLDKLVLNKVPNRDITKISSPEYQQTVFDRVEETLQYVDDSMDISTEPEPMQLFVGFNSRSEGSLRSILQLFKKEEIEFIISSSLSGYDIVSFETVQTNTDKYGKITLNTSSLEVFTEVDGVRRGLKVGQHLALFVKDLTNTKKQYISPNNGRLVKIREIYNRTIIVDFFNVDKDSLFSESTVVTDYPKTGSTTYLSATFKVWDKEIGRFMTYGQTEEEDIRYKIELGNIGKVIGQDDVFIFKQYDINEGGVDWTFLNKKRKEMLMMRHLIYPYIGAYKSIINAINYFGYNDLQLSEYYRNIDESSHNYLQLFKVEIPDIFDNTVEGWTDNDFIKHTLPNDKYDGTNLFNLTYFITDKTGTNVLTYSLDEVIIKLQGLKYWLQKNIIPLTHKILDITGRAYFNTANEIQHKQYSVQYINMDQDLTPITFKLNEAYLIPVNSGSTVYNCVMDFYSQTQSMIPDYYTIDIRTYKTYKEWAPFTTYNTGDIIIYYGKIYESSIDDNRVKNPRKYENSPAWSANLTYSVTNIVEYKRDIFVYSGLGTTSSYSPVIDTSNWLKITEWKQLDFVPVQTLQEFRLSDNLLPYNFTIDSNIDPFLVIEVTSDNGYGSNYKDKKNYEVRGLVDLRDPVRYIDPIGPFQPISPI